MASIEKRGSRWRVRVCRKGYPVQSKSFQTRTDAEKWGRKVERDIDQGILLPDLGATRITLAEALARYQREVVPRKRSFGREDSLIRKLLRLPITKMQLVALRAADVAKFRDDRLAEGESHSYVRLQLALLSHLFSIASAEWGWDSLRNPVQIITKPKPARGRSRRLKDGEEECLLAALGSSRNPWLRPITQLAIETGMRQGELLALRWEHMNLADGTAFLPDTKNGDERHVPLSTKAVLLLTKLPRSLTGRVFATTDHAVRNGFAKAARKAGCEGLRFHDCRHEAVSRFFELGLNPMEVASISGHRTLTMLKRYTHLNATNLALKIG